MRDNEPDQESSALRFPALVQTIILSAVTGVICVFFKTHAMTARQAFLLLFTTLPVAMVILARNGAGG